MNRGIVRAVRRGVKSVEIQITSPDGDTTAIVMDEGEAARLVQELNACMREMHAPNGGANV